MPRDLTDLMERATSFAPSEPHAAADVTSLAAARLRRRRAGLTGGLAVAVLAVAGLGYGITRGHDTSPEPASGYKYGRTVRAADAVPAASLPGYHAEPWTIPSIQHLASPYSPWPTYRSVDADGRLIVESYAGHQVRSGSPQVRLYDRPGASPSPLQVPPSPGSSAGQPIRWLPAFTGDGRLLWAPDPGFPTNDMDSFHVTDLEGGHDVIAHSGFTVGKSSFSGTPPSGTTTLGVARGTAGGWGLFGDRYWFTAYAHNLPHLSGAAFTLYTATFNGTLTKVANDVAVMAASDGRVAWVTTQGELMTETVADPTPYRVPVPLTAGCRLSPTIDLQGGLGYIATDRSVIAITERCGRGKDAEDELLALDPSGRMLVHLAGSPTAEISLTPDAILAESQGARTSDFDLVRYDLVTGRLADLGTFSRTSVPPQGAGDYVLWYDTDGGHVARIPG